MAQTARGWLRKKRYADGEVWLFCFYTRKPGKDKPVENSRIIGLVADFATESAALTEAAKRGYLTLVDSRVGVSPTFGELAQHFRIHELKKTSGIGARVGETVSTHESMLDGYILPRWGEVRALEITPPDVEAWFDELATISGVRKYAEGAKPPNGYVEKPLAWTSIQKIKSTMSIVFSHALRHKLIPVELSSNPFRSTKNGEGGVRCKSESAYEATVVTPEQMMMMLALLNTPTTRMEWVLALLHAATALRGTEGFGIKWRDIDWDKGQINLNRGWSKGKETRGKNKGSMVPVPMHPVLAGLLKEWRMETLYPGDEDWVFPSERLKGKKPRSASAAGKQYLRPAAVYAGVIEEGDPKRFGWHNLRHSLAEFLAGEVDPVVTMKTLRHKRLSTTTERYTHRITEKQHQAQGLFLKAIGKIDGSKKGKKRK